MDFTACPVNTVENLYPKCAPAAYFRIAKYALLKSEVKQN